MQYLLFIILTFFLSTANAGQSYYNGIQINDESASPILSLSTELVVPAKPTATGTLFLWPGLEPLDGGVNVLQPVLTWGPSCAPGKQPATYSTWWISAQFVSGTTQAGCSGGDIMAVAPGDTLLITMSLTMSTTSGNWLQVIKDLRTNQSVNFETSVKLPMVYALFDIESYQTPMPSDVVFKNTTITFSEANSGNCNLKNYDPKYTVAEPIVASDLKSCTISEIILRTPENPN